MLPGFSGQAEQNLDEGVLGNLCRGKYRLFNRLRVQKPVDNILKQSTDIVDVTVVGQRARKGN